MTDQDTPRPKKRKATKAEAPPKTDAVPELAKPARTAPTAKAAKTTAPRAAKPRARKPRRRTRAPHRT